MPEALDLNDIRDRLRRARATDEPYDAADQWAALGADVPALLDEVKRLRNEAEVMRLTLAMAGQGTDPNGYYADTPGTRVRQLLAAEAERDAALKVVHAAEAETDAARAAAALAHDPYGSDFQEAKARVELAAWQTNAAVDEWRAANG